MVMGAAGLYGRAVHQWHAARVAIEKGEPQVARGSLKICLLVWPNNAEVQLLAARACWLAGDFEGAEAHLKECTKLHNGATEETQLECLLMRAQTGEEDEVAPALFIHVDNKHPDSPLILETLARAYMHHLRHGQAYDCLSRWIREVPDSARAYHWRGWTFERLNNHLAAVEDYKKALELDPDLGPVRMRLAEIHLDRNLLLEAVPHLERLKKQFPGRPDIMVRLGHCRLLQGQGVEARQLLNAAMKELPDEPALLLNLARLEMQEGRPAEAEQWLRRCLKTDPGDSVARYMLVTSLMNQNRRDEANVALTQYEKNKALQDRVNQLLRDEAKRPSKDARAPSELGALLLDIGQERSGLYWLNQALLRDPGHLATHKALAEHFDRKGQPEKAAAHRRRLGGSAQAR